MPGSAVADDIGCERRSPAQREAEAARLEAEMAQVCGVVNAGAGRLVELIAEVLASGCWTGQAIRSPEHWVAWRCGVSGGRARSLVALARRRHELPVTAAALAAGSLSEDQAAVVARHAPASCDAQAAELAGHASVSQLRRVLGRYPFDGASPGGDEAGEPASAPPQEEIRRVSFATTERGTWRCSAELPPDEGALVERALAAERDRLFRESGGRADPDDESQGQARGRPDLSWADALVAMAERSLAAEAAAHPAQLRSLVLFHLDTERYGGPQAHPHGGPALPDSLRRLIGCDARVRPVWESNGHPVSVGRSTRVVPERTRVVIQERDRGCRVPGCDRSRWLHVHHIVHWEDGGATDTSNLVSLCPAHHRLHHRGGLGITGDAEAPEALVVTDARGRRLTGSGRPAPPGRPVMVAARSRGLDGTWVPPAGERLDPRWVEFRAG